jgi:hypothetical protein
MRWRGLIGLLGFIVSLALAGCGASATTVVTVVVTLPPGTPTANAAVTTTRTAELSQLATVLAPTATLAPTPRPSATAPPSATALPAAAPTAAPAGTLNVVQQGFGQDGRSVGYAFVAENPDPKLAIDFSQYRVTAYDAAGTVLRTDTSFIPVIFPGQRIGVAGEFAIAVDVRIVNVDFTVTPGGARPFEGQSPLTTANAVFQSDPTTGALVTGVVANAYPQDVRNVSVYAIVYEARDVIIGGGQKVIDRILGAGGQAGIEVTVTVIGNPARVELYATSAY